MRLLYRHVSMTLEEEFHFPVNKLWMLWLLRHCYKRFRQPQRAASLDPLLVSIVEDDVLKAFGLTQHSADRDHQDIDELMLDLPPAARVLDSFQLGDQGFKHAFPSAGKG